jgi:hypothetical protein
MVKLCQYGHCNIAADTYSICMSKRILHYTAATKLSYVNVPYLQDDYCESPESGYCDSPFILVFLCILFYSEGLDEDLLWCFANIYKKNTKTLNIPTVFLFCYFIQ